MLTLYDYNCLNCKKDFKNRHTKRDFCSRSCRTSFCNSKRILSEKTKDKIRIGHLGQKASFKTRSKMSLLRGGTGIPYQVIGYNDFTKTLKERIRTRDNYQCQECNTYQKNLKRKLDVHHIDYNKENCIEWNLIALCKSCHSETNFNRIYWENHFKIKMKERGFIVCQ